MHVIVCVCVIVCVNVVLCNELHASVGHCECPGLLIL